MNKIYLDNSLLNRQCLILSIVIINTFDTLQFLFYRYKVIHMDLNFMHLQCVCDLIFVKMLN